MIGSKHISERNKYWYTKCDTWISAEFPIRAEAAEVKAILDNGTCGCKKHNIYSIIKDQ